MRLLTILFTVTAFMRLDAATWNYPPAPRGEVMDDYHGEIIADPYRWMEDLDSEKVQEWVEAENFISREFLDSLPERNRFRESLTKLWNFPRFGLPFKEAGNYFFTKNDGLQNQAVLYTKAGLDAPPRVLLDPNKLSSDGTVALTGTAASPDGQWLAYGTSAAGSDWTEFRVRNVATADDAPDVLKWVKFSGPSWTKDSAGFFYSRFPAATKPGPETPAFAELANQKLYYHRLGTSQDDDLLIAEIPDEPKWFVNGEATEDGRLLVVTITRGDSPNTLVRCARLGDPMKPDVHARIEKIIDTWDAQNAVIGDTGDSLIVLTDLNAPRRRIVRIDLAHPERENWKELVPEGADAIEEARVVGGKLVVKTMHDASNRLVLYGLDGAEAGKIDLPGIGSVSGLSGREDDPELFYNFTSFTYPTANFRYDVASGGGELFNKPEVAFRPEDYETKQVFYPSKDGTKIPMFITAKRGTKLDGQNPTLLYGYGGFDIALTPHFSVTVLAWIEHGGVYAVANLRGGGEYGKEWHDAGRKENKQNVFDDFIAAAEWLEKHDYTSPEHLAINGGSNGGLLIGAVTNQRPDLFAAAIPEVGVMDMLRYQKFTIGYAWVSDYGSSDDAKEYAALRAYSPIHNIRAGVRYPAVLVMTADHDDRVFPAHSFKYTATLQAEAYNGPDAKPILIRVETRAGHGAGKPTAKIIDETADKLAFAAHFTGL